MTIITTISGNHIDYRNPDPKCVNMDDIIYGLEHNKRFGAHRNVWFTGLQHACFVAAKAWKETGEHELTLGSLHHDDVEAYTGDLPRPLKEMIPDFKPLVEQPLEGAIGEALEVTFDHERIKPFDMWSFEQEEMIASKFTRMQGVHVPGMLQRLNNIPWPQLYVTIHTCCTGLRGDGDPVQFIKYMDEYSEMVMKYLGAVDEVVEWFAASEIISKSPLRL